MSLSLRVLPWPWLIIILIAVCWGAAILYRGDRRLVPGRAGAVLVALRIALVSALAVLLARSLPIHPDAHASRPR